MDCKLVHDMAIVLSVASSRQRRLDELPHDLLVLESRAGTAVDQLAELIAKYKDGHVSTIGDLMDILSIWRFASKILVIKKIKMNSTGAEVENFYFSTVNEMGDFFEHLKRGESVSTNDAKLLTLPFTLQVVLND